MRKYGLYLFILFVFVFKLFDSLYIRPHSDAMNYHMYAPVLWAKYGLLHFNAFQSSHYQGTLFEILLSFIFKFWRPETIEQRESFFIFVQALSCFVGFLLIPLFLVQNFLRRFALATVFLILCCYYGGEYLSWAFQFAKNDVWACGAFLIGVFSPSFWLQVLGLGIAVGIKPTYFFGVAAYILIRRLSDKNYSKKLFFMQSLSVGLFLGFVFLRNYLATGNPIFPQPSSLGFQTSEFRKEYFHKFSGTSSLSEVGEKISLILKYTPGLTVLYTVLVFAILQMIYRSQKYGQQRIETSTVLLPFLLLPTLFLTGPSLEWRTFSGVVFASAIFAILFLVKAGFLKKKLSVAVLAFVFLTTSKIDLSSFNRWNENKNKTFWQMNSKSDVYRRVNETLNEQDILLNLNYSEGFFLKPQMYTVDEHPQHLEIIAKYSELQDTEKFIAVHTNGSCFGEFSNDNFVKPLLEKSSADLKPDAEASNLFHLQIDC